MRRLGRTGLALAVAAAVALAGCGAPDDETAPAPSAAAPRVEPEVPDELPILPTGTGPVGPGDPVRATALGLRVRGREYPLAPLRADALAVVPGGVYFLNGAELWFTDLRRARPTGYGQVASLRASADGRWLGLIDVAHGSPDAEGTPMALSIGFDAATGASVAASYAGMGELSAGGLAELYRDHPPRILGFDAAVMRVSGGDGSVAEVRLDGG